MSRIFITGATGYIGGDVLYALTETFRSSKIMALVRNESRASLVTAKFPYVTPVIGDLDSTSRITSEASEADVVLTSARAITQGLTESKRQKPVWIQMSGASLLSGPDISNKAYGQARPQDHNDLHGVSEIRNIITSSPNRVVDNLLLNLSATQPRARTAIVYGPLIYGMGRGPAKQRSIQLPDLANATLQHGYGLQIGKGLSCWSNIHISDLARLIVRLVQEATSAGNNPSLWNENGIYFAENGKLSFGEISKRVALFAYEKGFVKSPAVQDLDEHAADRVTAHGAVLLGTNAQYTAVRARELLGWRPQGPSLAEEIPRAVLEENLRLRSKL